MKYELRTNARKRIMLHALEQHHGNVMAASRSAGIDRTTHYQWLKTDNEYSSAALQYSIQSAETGNPGWKKLQASNGYVYLIQCENTTFYKIGISKIDYYLRLASMQSGCPLELKFVDAIHSDDYKNLEQDLHRKLRDRRIRGEWFDLDEVSLRMVKKYFEENSQPQTKIEFPW